MMTRKLSIVFSLFLAIGIFAPVGMAQTTGFTYQGSLNSGGVVANGNHDFEFALFDALSGGAQLGATITQSSVSVTNGIFAVSLDFGSQFPGAQRFLEIRVRPSGVGVFTPLTPRQQITSAPYSVKSLNSDTATTATNATTATTATNALQLGGLPAGQYVITTDPRLTNERQPAAGSSNYIQNVTAEQPASNFNVSGNGTAAGTLSANTLSGNFVNALRYNINGTRVLSTGPSGSFFAGPNAGAVNTGGQNSFFGNSAGFVNTTDGNNSFFGNQAGAANTTGATNSFFGASAGIANTTASKNSFFGSSAGIANTTGGSNSFFGDSAGLANTTARDNTFFGASAGQANTSGSSNSAFGSAAGQNNTGTRNSFFGDSAGFANTTGGSNSFFGQDAGSANTVGNFNTIIGNNADVGANNLTNATAIGANAVVSQSNSMVLGDNVNVGIGNSAPADKLDVDGDIRVGTSGTNGCLKNNNGGTITGTCSSDIRFKQRITPFSGMLDKVTGLSPVNYYWRASEFPNKGFGNAPDYGLIAQDVERIAPELVSEDSQGYKQIDYSKLPLMTIQAVKELKLKMEEQHEQIEKQQAQIESQRREIELERAANARQSAKIDALVRLVCASNKDADICKEQ